MESAGRVRRIASRFRRQLTSDQSRLNLRIAPRLLGNLPQRVPGMAAHGGIVVEVRERWLSEQQIWPASLMYMLPGWSVVKQRPEGVSPRNDHIISQRRSRAR